MIFIGIVNVCRIEKYFTRIGEALGRGDARQIIELGTHAAVVSTRIVCGRS